MNYFRKANPDSGLGGLYRVQPEDFQVEEIPSFKPSGEGEHVYLHVRKTAQNSDWVAGRLARMAGIKRRDVGYAGLKDRHAVTTQWFSLWMPGQKTPDWSQGLPEGVEILEETLHLRKLQRGVLDGNRFRIRIRNFRGDLEALDARIDLIREQGVPNYFGQQRFGRDRGNIERAQRWFEEGHPLKNRQKRSLYLSAARAWLFNHVLAERVTEGNWNQPVAGELFMLDGSNSWFHSDIDETIERRLSQRDIHPSGPLWGCGQLQSQGMLRELESRIVADFPSLTAGLEKHGLKQQRRATRVNVKEMDYTSLNNDIVLRFVLPPGAYATTVLNEIGDFSEGAVAF